MHQRVSQKRRRGPLLARLRAWPQYAARLITVVAPSQFLSKGYVDGLAAHFFDAAFKAGCNANVISFKQMLNALRAYHEDTKLSTLTLLAIFGTDNPSLINAIPLEEFIDRVDDMKRKLELPVTRLRRPEVVAARRAEWEAGTPMFKRDGCSIAFSEKLFDRRFFLHVSGHQPGPTPTPVQRASYYCREKKACEDCQKWVRKVAEGASLETPGAGWVPSRDQVLRCAARVRAALPEITFGGVELPELICGGRKSKPAKSKAPEPAPPPRSKRARRAPK